MSLFLMIVKVVFITLYIALMGQVILYPVQRELQRIADFFDSFEVTIEEKESNSEQ